MKLVEPAFGVVFDVPTPMRTEGHHDALGVFRVRADSGNDVLGCARRALRGAAHETGRVIPKNG